MRKSLLCGSASFALALCAFSSFTLGAGKLYGLDSSRRIYTLDLATGAATQVGTLSTNVGTSAGLAYDTSTDTMYATSSSNDSLFSVDLTTFNATLVGAYGDSTVVMHGLEYDGVTNTLWGASGGGGNFNFYNINKATGAATVVGPLGVLSFTNLGYDSAADKLYATNSDTDSFYSVNRATGAMTLIGALGGPTNPNGLAFNKDDGTMYLICNSTDTLYKVDTSTGAALAIGAVGSTLTNALGLVYVPDVPEPSSLGAIAAMGLFVIRRRR
jgi:sugar lactone lactonase YvrE